MHADILSTAIFPIDTTHDDIYPSALHYAKVPIVNNCAFNPGIFNRERIIEGKHFGTLFFNR